VDAFLPIVLRWIHIASVVVLVGGVFFALISGASLLRFKPWVYAAALGILGSGLCNFFMKTSYPRGYHMWFGIKVLFALHVLAAAILLRDGKQRSMKGIVVSAAVVIAISAYLRWISLL
jgi:hypothetical protein